MDNQREWTRSPLWYLLPLLVFLASFAFRWNLALNHDVAWLLFAAGRMLAGGTYSNDFFEINMPLAVAIYIPPQGLARLSGWPLPLAHSLWVYALILQSAGLALWANSRNPQPLLAGLTRPLELSWLVAGLALLPGYDFGQKEHLLAILCLPFLFLVGNARQPRSLPLRLYVSVLAGIGFFLKPHFAGLPLLILAACACQERSWRRLWSAEALAIAATGLAYAVIVLRCFPDWFEVARWGVDLYGGYRRHAWSEMFQVDSVPLCTAVLALLLLLAWRSREFRSAALPFLVAAVYAWLAYLLQLKGWRYQFLAAAIPLFVLLPLAWAVLWNTRPWQGWARVAAVVAAIAGLLLAAEAVAATAQAPKVSQLPRSQIGQALQIAAKGDYVYAFTTTVTPVFPTVLLLDLNWASRYPALWPLAGLAAPQGPEQPDALRQRSFYKERLVASVVDDFARYRPGIVLVDKRPDQFGLPPGYDILSFFSGAPRFDQMWSGYMKIGEERDWAIYARSDDHS